MWRRAGTAVRPGRHANRDHRPAEAALQPILASAAIKARIISLGAEPASSTPDQLAKILANDLERLQPIVKHTGASLD